MAVQKVTRRRQQQLHQLCNAILAQLSPALPGAFYQDPGWHRAAEHSKQVRSLALEIIKHGLPSLSVLFRNSAYPLQGRFQICADTQITLIPKHTGKAMFCRDESQTVTA